MTCNKRTNASAEAARDEDAHPREASLIVEAHGEQTQQPSSLSWVSTVPLTVTPATKAFTRL